MTRPIVVDASVAVKWSVVEDHHLVAKGLLDLSDRLVAPDLLLIEVASVAWRKVMRGEIAPDQAQGMVELARMGVATLYGQTDLLGRALALALALRHPVYDCVYLACTELTGGLLVTADQRLERAVAGSRWRGSVVPLAEPALAARLDP